MRRAWLALGLLLPLACGDDDLADAPAPASSVVDASVGDAILPVEAGARDAIAPVVASTEPSGLDALTPEAFAHLYRLRLGSRLHHTSSADPSGGNADYGHALGRDRYGDAVLWDRTGPGALRRIWLTGFAPQQRLKMYFDGEETPRLDLAIADFFAGAQSGLPSPLVLTDERSAGGFVSAVPFPYARSLRVTVTDSVRYYNIDGYALGGAPEPWTGAADTSAAQALFARAGVDPKPVGADVLEVAQTFDLEAGGERVLADVTGPRSISAIELRVPGVVPLPPSGPLPEITESGRSVSTESSFQLAVDPDNYGVMLRRLIDYSVPDQRVQVAVDGVDVGAWSSPGADSSARFRTVGFFLPEAVTRGKSRLTLRLRGLSPAWNEYRIEAIAHTARGRIVGDSIDVGEPGSEQAHAYAALGASEPVVLSAREPSFAELAAKLAGLRLAIRWDDEAEPSVDAPIDSLFAIGIFGPGQAAGLGAGLRADGTLYLYFPMPFARRARITLRSTKAEPAGGLSAVVRHEAFTDSFDDVGALSSAWHEETSAPGRDLTFLRASGSGQVVAVTQSLRDGAARGFMQGDERIYVDGARTPVVQGTGTEDFYNGGFYFRGGPFAQATHGESTHVGLDGGSGTALYRQLIGDPITFRAGIHLSIEHGADNAVPVSATMLTLYYRQPRARLLQSDALIIGDASSEQAHAYAAEGERWRGASTLTFEGDADDVPWTATGRSHHGSRFELAIDPSHVGVTLRRLFDQSQAQRAEIWVDGAFAGEWWSAEHNETHRFREEDFDLPLALTAGKARLAIEVRVPATAPAWSEYQLAALCRIR